ncbi:NAD-P-binding protein, partial [Epithele typhae]|uniref:NAD-P-binding protein n=1 Tax=Epithele typhae TaxID=378194 RepID=UPI0020079E80
NRGIGLEFTKQLIQRSDTLVIATCRDPAKSTTLSALAADASNKLHVVPLDVTSTTSAAAAAKTIAALLGPEQGIDYLINNAGINPWPQTETAYDTDIDLVQRCFEVNTLGALRVTQQFVDLVARGAKKTVVNISSTLGSMGTDYVAVTERNAAYAVSKAGLNMVTRKQAMGRSDLVVVSICPNYVKTDIGGPNAFITAADSVENILKTVAGLTQKDSGTFMGYTGYPIPW